LSLGGISGLDSTLQILWIAAQLEGSECFRGPSVVVGGRILELGRPDVLG
jgi:hypothetical protein